MPVLKLCPVTPDNVTTPYNVTSTDNVTLNLPKMSKLTDSVRKSPANVTK